MKQQRGAAILKIKNRHQVARRFKLEGERDLLRIDSVTKDILRKLIELVKKNAKKPEDIAFYSMSRIADAAIKTYSMILQGRWILFDVSTDRPVNPDPNLNRFMLSKEKLAQFQVVGAVALLRAGGYGATIARTPEGVVTVSFGGDVVDPSEYEDEIEKAMGECTGMVQ